MRPRIWDIVEKKYIDSIEEAKGGYLEEQNTGLKDGDGNYIYENDVWRRNKEVYHYWSGKKLFWKNINLSCILIFKNENNKWSVEEEEDCNPSEGFVIGTIHDVENT
jgi:hypothetical protein